MLHDRCKSEIDAADHPPRGIFHPLGAAFFSNDSYSETVKVIQKSGVAIEEFALAGARQMYRFNITTGVSEAVPALTQRELQLAGAELPRYIQLWKRDFEPINNAGYKVRAPCGVAISHED